MNKFKKIMVGAVVVAGVACLGGAAACAQKAPKYYNLSFEGNVEFVMHDALAVPDENNNVFESGTVKEGVEVKFSLVLAANSKGTPVVTLNGEPLQPVGENLYSFIMSRDSKVEVTGVNTVYDLTLGKYEKLKDEYGNEYKEERRVTYLDENGKELPDNFKVEEGSDFKFKLKVSSYYIKKKDKDGNPVYEDDPAYASAKLAYTVKYNYEILEPDANGVYTIKNITSNNDVDIIGLEQEPSFTQREDGGNGTETDPYLLKRPIDLFTVAGLVNSDYYTNFGGFYYKLANDIDMDGEQMYVIGDGTSNTAMFYGHFDGNGKTVSNFFMTDEVINQEDFTRAYLPHMGFFGNVFPSIEEAAVIKDLHLKDYRIDVHPGAAAEQFAADEDVACVGSLVGFGVGAQISGCSVENGTITASGDDNQMIYMGGMIGLMQSYYSNQAVPVAYNSFVSSSAAINISMEGTGSPRSTGGIAGYAISADINSISYIVNCSVTGSISSGMHVGGIVGTLGRFSTVTSCYSDCDISAYNGIVGDFMPTEYICAYAGGIAGFAEADTVVALCYSACDKKLMDAFSEQNSSYANTDELVGGKAAKKKTANGDMADDSMATDSAEVILYNNKLAASGDNFDVLTGTLGWNTADWEWNSKDGAPAVKYNGGDRKISVKVYYKDSTESHEFSKNLSASHAPVYSWYNDKNMPEYLTSEDYFTSHSGRSWGYYFDAECTQKVPYGFVPTAAVTNLYVGYADYSEVAGRYYVKSAAYSNGAYIELSEDGEALIRNGGMTLNCQYSYDGEKITIYNTCLASLVFPAAQADGAYASVVGEATAEGFEFTGKVSMLATSGTGYTTENIQLATVKDSADRTFCGEYNGSNGATYTFNRDLTFIYQPVTGNRETYTYTVNNGVITVNNGGQWEATVVSGVITEVNSVAVSKKDAFVGAWQTSANAQITFEFDGLLGVKYTVSGSAPVETTGSMSESRFTFEIGETEYEAWFDSEGLLVINGERYSRADGFTGKWYFVSQGGNQVRESIDVVFSGIGADGYGYAEITYMSGVVTTVNAQYDLFTDDNGTKLRLFVGDSQYAELEYQNDTKNLAGSFLSISSGNKVNVGFSLYDAVAGQWVCNTNEIKSVTFNGKSGNSGSQITIRYNDNTTERGTYTFNGKNGTATAAGKQYTFVYDEATGMVTLTETGSTANVLAKTDAWAGTVLYDGETSYTFNGKGYLGGAITVSDGSELSYTIDNKGNVYVGEENELLEKTAQGFNYGVKQLVFKTGFANEWMIGGTQDTLTIGEVTGEFTAQVSYSGVSGTFTFEYNPSDNSLSYTEVVRGERIITTLRLNGDKEMSISRGTDYLNCTVTDNADGWQGKYVSADNSSWTFDGLGKCRYTVGSAIYYNAVTGLELKYEYSINDLGLPEIMLTTAVVFTVTDEGGYKKDEAGLSYTTAIPDALYEKQVYTVNDEVRVRYAFDGANTLWERQSDGTYIPAYKYRMISLEEVELTDSDGKKYSGRLEEDVSGTKIEIEEITAQG
ncbi:MAG: hypothetical protein K2N14_02715 [Clostridia bacterium]|nr:hypothetical protein [Clostridia bacterium]